jgi:hypothetical protein
MQRAVKRGKGSITLLNVLADETQKEINAAKNSCLKGQCHEIFDFRFSTWISFPQAPDYSLIGQFKIFRKFAEIFAAQDAKIFIISFGHLWVVK